MNVTKPIEYATCVAIFVLAITLYFNNNARLESLLLNVKNNINDNQVVYEQYQDLEKLPEPITEYKELVSILMKDISINMEINGTELRADTYDYMEFDYSSIPNTNYRKSYKRDVSGNVVKVIYESIS